MEDAPPPRRCMSASISPNSPEMQQFPQTEDGRSALVATLHGLGPALIVVEATGRYELEVVAALGLAKLPVAVLDPRQVRDFVGTKAPGP